MRDAISLLLLLAFASSATAADPHSYADPDRFLVRHIALDLRADFTAHRLEGTAELTIEQLDPAAEQIHLDTRDLEIQSVQLIDDAGTAPVLAFRTDPPDPILGSRLTIALSRCCPAPKQLRLRIAYRTSPEASALQWLDPAQTSGPHPYMYSQGQAIHTRSWIPAQDTPGVRMTYSARIRTPPELVAVMSAARVVEQDDVPGEYRFEMRQPIPAYLVALAIGDLRFRSLGERVGVWTEPSQLDAAAHEFADLPRMLEAGERMVGPYRWDRYDLLIMPHSFAFGGMENPRLSFISPSVVAGDRSLVAVIVHELAHSWSGNLVTSATWNDFWLNEGFTTYLERRLFETLYGERRARMEDAIGYEYLTQAIADAQAAGLPQDSSLRLDLAGRDPDEGTSDVAYEKGRWFLGYLESRFGRPAFDAFLREYFDAHAFRSMDTAGFRTYLLARLASPGAPAIPVAEIDEWLYGTGMPATTPPIPSDVFIAVDRAAAQWRAGRLAIPGAPAIPVAEIDEWLYGTGMPATTPPIPSGVFIAVDRAAAEWRAGRLATEQLPVRDWAPQEWVRFLDGQPADLDHTKLAGLRAQFKLGTGGNAEIARSWLALVVRSAYEPAYADLERYLLSTGRHKLVVGLYRDLARTASGLELGRRIYSKARPGYHATIRAAVERLLQLESSSATG